MSDINRGPKPDATYLGDGVYASFDGWHIILDLRGQDDYTRIAMEPPVLEALNRFRARISDETKETQ